MSDNTVPSGTFGDYSETNSEAEPYPSFYDICDRSGFRVKAGKLIEDWGGIMVRPEDYDGRHPQELVRGIVERPSEQLSPEPEDTFLSTNQVSASDL
jgi:hypothetical protein